MKILDPDPRVARFAARFHATPGKDVLPGTTWDVHLAADTRLWACECPAFEFGPRPCKHVVAAMAAFKAQGERS